MTKETLLMLGLLCAIKSDTSKSKLQEVLWWIAGTIFFIAALLNHIYGY